MSTVIAVLDEATRNKIAAGEVVERPASCIKELVENSIDAGATMIEVEIADGGQSYMRVTDDGCGMGPEDARICIVRHATSKIRTVEDIFSITSLGFRGEAVPSIAAVSHFQITTRRKEDEFASHLVLQAGEIITQEQVGAPAGTTMEVSDLFFNTPARRKFLKSTRTEMAKISEMLTKLSLAHPAIGFTFINNGRTTLQTGGSGSLQETVADIYGAEVAKEVFPLGASETEEIGVSGFVGRPSILKSSRMWQTCVVNHRIVYNPMLFKAIDNAYHAMLPKAGYPFALLHIQLDPAALDVNVHPAKTEIKFADEKAVYRAVYHAIVGALVAQEEPERIARPIAADSRQLQHREEAAADFVRTQEPERVWEPTALTLPEIPEERRSAGYAAHRGSALQASAPVASVRERRENPYTAAPGTERDFSVALHAGEATTRPDAQIHFEEETDFVPLGAVADCYIIAKKGRDLYIIDQHAAHERVRYDRFCRQMENVPSQQLLTPEFVEADETDMVLLTEQRELFRKLGYTYSEAGPTTIRIEEVPADLPGGEIKESLQTICRGLRENKHWDKATIRHRALAYMACRGAIKAGDKITIREMQKLLEDLFRTEKPFVCPHGRPVIIRFTAAELAKLFKRT